MSSRDPLPSAIPWLLRVSLASLFVQVVALVVSRLADLPYAYGLATLCLVLMGLSHAALVRALRGVGDDERAPFAVGAYLAAQVIFFTLALAATGGPSNPSSVFYLVYVAFAALALGARWGAGLALITTLAYGSLFALTEAKGLHAIHQAGGFVGHLVGMWLAYALSATLVATFLVRALAAVASKDRDLDALREKASRQAKLLALGQLAAGAAHELGSPLSTIAVIAKELEKSAQRDELDVGQLFADATTLREQAERCRKILEKMGAQSGAAHGEIPEAIDADVLAADVCESLGHDATHIDVTTEGEGASPPLPRRALVQAIVNLAKNAVDATPVGASRPRVQIACTPQLLRVTVTDRGRGIDEAIRARIGEPFVTTKAESENARGMGLGLFLVHSLAENLGGDFVLASVDEYEGTRATLEFRASSMHLPKRVSEGSPRP